MQTIADTLPELDSVKVFVRLKATCPVHNLKFSVRQSHLFYQDPETDKTGEVVRDSDGNVKTRKRYRFRAIDIPHAERWFASNEDQEGRIKPGKVHEMTAEEFEWLRREISCHVIRFEHKTRHKDRAIGPNNDYARARLVRYRRQDHEKEGEFLIDPSYQPARGIGGTAVDVPIDQFIEIRRALPEDEQPVRIDPQGGGISDWESIKESHPNADEQTVEALRAQLEDLRKQLKKQEDAEASALESEKTATRRGRGRPPTRS